MRNAVLTIFYTLGLSAFFPLLIINHRSNAALPMFLAPILAAALAEGLGRVVRIAKDTAENRVIWLIGAFILISQAARFTLGLDASGFTEYMALNVLYQILLGLVIVALDRRENKGTETGPRHFFRFGSARRTGAQ
jgi:hypothetical protein